MRGRTNMAAGGGLLRKGFAYNIFYYSVFSDFSIQTDK